MKRTPRSVDAREASTFLNVDLELVSGASLDPLISHWSASMITLRNSEEEGRQTVWMELGEQHHSAESCLRAFLRLLEALPSGLRALWDGCDDRCFNVGVQGGSTPHAHYTDVSPQTLAGLVAANSRLVVTVYADASRTDRKA